MVLFLGVARALKAMHQHKIKGAPGGANAQRKAKGVRKEAALADQDAARKAKAKQRRKPSEQDAEQADVEAEPLMEGEVTMSQAGLDEGETRAYAHRDIKPGSSAHSPPPMIQPSNLTNTQAT